jgi:hypothetical protein
MRSSSYETKGEETRRGRKFFPPLFVQSRADAHKKVYTHFLYYARAKASQHELLKNFSIPPLSSACFPVARLLRSLCERENIKIHIYNVKRERILFRYLGMTVGKYMAE